MFKERIIFSEDEKTQFVIFGNAENFSLSMLYSKEEFPQREYFSEEEKDGKGWKLRAVHQNKNTTVFVLSIDQ